MGLVYTCNPALSVKSWKSVPVWGPCLSCWIFHWEEGAPRTWWDHNIVHQMGITWISLSMTRLAPYLTNIWPSWSHSPSSLAGDFAAVQMLSWSSAPPGFQCTKLVSRPGWLLCYQWSHIQSEVGRWAGLHILTVLSSPRLVFCKTAFHPARRSPSSALPWSSCW